MRLRTFALFLLSATCFAQTMVPVAPKHPVTDVYPGGIRVVDDYRWLEDGTSGASKQWAAEQNAHTSAVIDALPLRNRILTFLQQQDGQVTITYSKLQVRGGRLFAMRRSSAESAGKLVTYTDPEDKASERVVLDLAKLTPDHVFQADWFSVSPDAKLVGVALSANGSEDGALHVFSTATGQSTEEPLSHVQYPTAGGAMAWKADSSGFYYTRYPRGTERPAEDANFYQQLYFHKLGTPTAADTYVLGREMPRIGEIGLTSSPDGRHILVSVEDGDGAQFEFFLVGPDSSVRRLCTFKDKVASVKFGMDNSLWLLSQKASPSGAFLHLPAGWKTLAEARTVIPASNANFEPDTSFNKQTRSLVVADRLFTTVIDGGPETIRVYSLDGKRLPDVPLPAVARIGGLVADGEKAFLVAAETYTRPMQWYSVSRSGSGSGSGFGSGFGRPQALPLRSDSATSLADIEVERVFATSKDGTRVPITLLHRKGLKLDGNNPTILYGYGGYGISWTPFFDPQNRLLYDAGGIYALANIRGGGEYGDAWHTAGSLLNKQNVFDDFAASAQFLIDRHYTSSAHLAAEGGSNGGLLMGAMLTQHPALFKAVLSEVGIYDMLRVELDPNGVFNTTEFGSTKDPAQAKYLYAYSPYHHVVPGTRYPATLFVTGDNDNRVNPAHSRKMIALLQASTGSDAPILLLTNAHAGHGFSTNVSESELESADSFAFIYSQIGVTLP